MNKVLSDRGSLIIYLDKVSHFTFPHFAYDHIITLSTQLPSHNLSICSLQVSHKQREEVAFKIRQSMRVGVLEPAAVSIYEYYEREYQKSYKTTHCFVI